MSLVYLKALRGVLIFVSALLVLVGCGGSNSQASIIGKWQLVEISYNTDHLPIPTEYYNVQIQFYKESAVSINAPVSGGTIGGDGTYKFVDEKNIQIEMPQGSQGLEALKTFIRSIYGNRVTLIVGAQTPTPTPLPPPPVLDTNFRNGIYEVQISGDQLTMKGKDGVTATFKKVN